MAFAGIMAGAVIQGTIGFGLSLIAVPTFILLKPEALPATLLFVAFPMTIFMAARERGALDVRGFWVSTAGRVVGTGTAVWLLAIATDSFLEVLAGGAILAAAVVSALAPDFESTSPTHLVAGVAAGVMGTVGAVGGPPLALAFQDRPGPQLRSTLAVSFLAGVILSLTGLTIAGEVQGWQALLALQLVPAMALGLILSGRIARHLDPRWLRPVVLSFAAIAGAVAVVRGLLG